MRRLAAIAAFLATVVAGDRLREAARAEAPSAVDAALELPALPADVVRVAALGFDSAVADASYLGAVQAFGDSRYASADRAERLRRSTALARLLEYTTDLDPTFAYAYVFGAVAIPIDEPATGNLLNAEEAIRLLRKGTAAVPDDWRIPFHLGYLLANGLNDYPAAAEAMAIAARRPRHPEYVVYLATRLAAQGGALDTGVELAKAMLANAETDAQRDELTERLRLLSMEQDLRAIEAAADRFRARTGAYPPDAAALVRAGDLPALPAEPHGGQYTFDPATGQAASTAAARLRLFDSARRDQERSAAAPPGGTPP